MRFNARVLEEALDLWHPLLERVKLLAICGSNLDEFFMTRVARLIKKINKGSSEKSVDGMTATEQIEATRKEILPLIEKHAACWRDELVPALAKEDICIRDFSSLSSKQKETLRAYFSKIVLPSLKISKEGFNGASIENLHLNLFVYNGFPKTEGYYVLDVPTEKFGRLIRIPKGSYDPESTAEVDSIEFDYVFLEDLLANSLDLIFPHEQSLKAYPFRLTRNGEIDIVMDESSDFLASVQKSLKNRKTGFSHPA